MYKLSGGQALITWRRWLARYGFWAVYVALSVLMTWPLIAHLDTHLAGSDADLFNVYWGNWWVRRALSTVQNPYQTPYLLYPTGFDLTFFAFSPFLALIWMPLGGLFSSIAAYNLVLLVTIVLCCIAMEQLVCEVTGDAWAARVAAITFGFAPCIAAQRAAHLNLAMLAWIPWGVLLLARLLREARIRDTLLLAATVVLAFLTRLHIGVLVLLFCGVYLVAVMLIQRRPWHKSAWRRILLAGLLSLLLLSPLALRIARAMAEPGGDNILREEAEVHQADLLAYLVPPPQHPFFGRWTKPIYDRRFLANSDRWVYLGLVPLALVAFVAVTRPKKAGPWLLTGLFFFILSLGPSLRAGGTWYAGVKLPYAWGERLFTLAGFNVPNRFSLALASASSVLVGLACAEIATYPKRRWFLCLVAALILIEYLVVPIPLLSPPRGSAFYDRLAGDGQDYALVDLPLTRGDGEVHRFYQTLHHKPIVGGWNHRVPATAFEFIDSVPLLEAWSGRGSEVSISLADLADLAQSNVRYVVLHKDQLKSIPGGMDVVLFALKPIYRDRDLYVWPTDPATSEMYNIAHVFDEKVQLLQPAVFLSTELPMPELSLKLCWLLDDSGQTVDELRVTQSAVDGTLRGQERTVLSAGKVGLACQTWSWSLEPSHSPGPLVFYITPFIAGQSLGAYSYTAPELHVFRDVRGRDRLLLGQALPVNFDAPIKAPGYRLAAGEDLLRVDVYWHSQTDHHQAYRMFVQLINLSTGQLVANSDDLLHRLDWEQGDLLQSHRMLFLDQVAPGTYQLGFGLARQDDPSHRVPAYSQGSRDRAPGGLVTLDHILVVPRALQEATAAARGQMIFYTDNEGQSQALDQQTHARFGKRIQLIGYSLNADEMTVAQDSALTLYWVASYWEPTETDYQVFVHLVDESGRIIAQHDGEPVGGHKPTSSWRTGEYVVDVHKLVWQVDAYAGQATIFVGLYDGSSQKRLPAYRPDGDRFPHDAVPLGRIQIR